MAKNTKGKKTVESVAETLCSFSRFLCDLVIGIYLFVILAVLPLYNRGYAQIGTDKENFFINDYDLCGEMSASGICVVADPSLHCGKAETGASGISDYSEKNLAGFEHHG